MLSMSFIDKAKEAFEHAKDVAAEKLAEVKEAVAETVDKVQDAAANAKADGDHDVETLSVPYEAGLPLPAQGVLKAMGYRVGYSGLPEHERREILHRTFQVQLVAPLTAPSDYIAEWGERCSYARFVKMDNVLGGLAANAERKKADMSEAIRNWREDQDWLRRTYQEWMDHTH
jgi:hypothetical protein